MAQPINCDNQCGTLAMMMWTEIGTGEVQAYCAPCMAEVCMAIAREAGLADVFVTAEISSLVDQKVLRWVKGKPAPAPQPATPQDPDGDQESDDDPAADKAPAEVV